MTLLDYSTGPIPGAAIKAAGHDGAIRYVDNPAVGLNPKHITPTEYADLLRAGCAVWLVFEDGTADINGGFGAGAANAARAKVGAAWIGYTGPIFMACDEHLTAAQLPLGMAYLDGAASVLGLANTGAYGFPEFIDAAHSGDHATWLWQCGSPPPASSPAHLWQDNTTSTTVAGVVCDINHVYPPLPSAVPSLSREVDPMAPIPILVKPDGTFRATTCAESGGGSQVVAQAWLDLGTTWGGASFRATVLGNTGQVLATWPTTPGLGHVANNGTVTGIALPAGTCMVTVEGKVDDPNAGTIPAASVVSKAR